MDNVISLFGKPKTTAKKDVSKETYFFTFIGTTFHFGGGAFTRDLLERLDANREAVKQLVASDAQMKRAALANYDTDAETKTLLNEAVRLEDNCAQAILDTLHTPNELDDYLSDDNSIGFMPLILAATIHTAYVPFDLMRMQRASWCLLEDDANDFMTKLHTYFTTTDKEIKIIRIPEMDNN